MTVTTEKCLSNTRLHHYALHEHLQATAAKLAQQD